MCSGSSYDISDIFETNPGQSKVAALVAWRTAKQSSSSLDSISTPSVRSTAAPSSNGVSDKVYKIIIQITNHLGFTFLAKIANTRPRVVTFLFSSLHTPLACKTPCLQSRSYCRYPSYIAQVVCPSSNRRTPVGNALIAGEHSPPTHQNCLRWIVSSPNSLCLQRCVSAVNPMLRRRSSHILRSFEQSRPRIHHRLTARNAPIHVETRL